VAVDVLLVAVADVLLAAVTDAAEAANRAADVLR
jgi:hypothetical protein